MISPATTAVLLPAYKPDDRVAPYVQALCEAGIGCVVVVDDGSGPDYRARFDTIPENDIVHTIHYEPNQGKGIALKTGMKYIQEHRPDAEIIVTADSDGQHTVKDVLRMVETMSKDPEGLWLGSRDFSQENVPFKSRAGNRITTVMFKLLYGQWVSDTQTGLRGFAKNLLPLMIEVPGERYEYEMKVLIACAEQKIPMKPLTIETVYENNNECSHFHAFRDGFRIYKVLLGSFFKFIGSSLICSLLDYLLYLLFLFLLDKFTHVGDSTFRFLFFSMKNDILIATATARVISGTVNYFLNSKTVFKGKDASGSFVRYLCVFLMNLFLSAGITSMLHLFAGCNEKLIKLPVDILLFLLSYKLQQNWVFKKNNTTEAQK